jgi:death-on-curing protein
MKYISIDYILKLHKKLILATGGSNGIRDMGLLRSAIDNSKSTFYGEELYPSIEAKCANICYSIINNHAFIDGNKRIGIYVMLVLLEYNGVKLNFLQSELINLGLSIAEGKYNKEAIENWIKSPT